MIGYGDVFGFTGFYRAKPRPGSNLDLAIKPPGQETQPTVGGRDVIGSYFCFTCLDRPDASVNLV
jgi:hypothetical protein